MKRSGPIQRRTPLKNTGKIKQGKSLSHEWPEATKVGPVRKPMKRSPSGRRPPATRSKIPDSIRAKVVARSGGKCEVKVAQRCRETGGQLHHRLMRSQGGCHTVSNLIDVCSICHRWIHDHPELSYEQGHLLRRTAS